MYDLDAFVVAVYCLITDALYARFCQRYGRPRRAGFESALPDEECLTIEIVGQFLGYPTQKQFYERMHDPFGARPSKQGMPGTCRTYGSAKY